VIQGVCSLGLAISVLVKLAMLVVILSFMALSISELISRDIKLIVELGLAIQIIFKENIMTFIYSRENKIESSRITWKIANTDLNPLAASSCLPDTI